MDPPAEQQQTQSPRDFNSTGESRADESAEWEWGTLTYFFLPVLTTLVTLGFIGNIIILHAVCAVRRFNRAENLMLANLSATSIAILISTISVYIHMNYPLGIYGSLYCKLIIPIHTFSAPAEGFTMVCISLERTRRVRFPLRRETKVSAIKKIVIVWVLALLVDLPRGLLFFKYVPDNHSLVKCVNTKEILGTYIPYVIYVTTSYSLTFLLPSFLLARDWIRLVSQLRFLIACQTLPVQNEYRKRQMKLIRHAIIFTSIFIAVKLPVGTYFLLYQLPPHLLSESVIGWMKTWKRFFFSVSLVHGWFYPLTIFGLSRDIRKYVFCGESERRHPPAVRC